MSKVETPELVVDSAEKPALNYKELANELKKRLDDVEKINKTYLDKINELSAALQQREQLIYLLDGFTAVVDHQLRQLRFSIDLTKKGDQQDEQ